MPRLRSNFSTEPSQIETNILLPFQSVSPIISWSCAHFTALLILSSSCTDGSKPNLAFALLIEPKPPLNILQIPPPNSDSSIPAS
ncbi:hypothetical protein VTL71DRAFT_14786, partial [Oculimacula yallundae]